MGHRSQACKNRAHARSFVRKLTQRVSRRSNALSSYTKSSYTQTQRSCWTHHARRLCACSCGRAESGLFDLLLHGVVELSLRRCVLFRALNEDSSGSGGALSPLLPQQAQSESPCSTIPFLCLNTRRWVTGRINRAHDDAMQVQIDQAASCNRCYTRRCVSHERCVCV